MTMTVWTSDEKIIDTLESFADEFRAQNPELGDFQVQSIPFADYTKQLSVQLTGGEAPDLAWVVEANVPAFIASGALADISSVAGNDAFDVGDYLPNVMQQVTDGDSLYAIPFSNGAQPLIYNTAAFEAAGVETPQQLIDEGAWTWKNLRRIAKEMVDSGEVTYGFDIPQFALQNYQFMGVFLKGWGAQAYPEGTSCGLDSAESEGAFQYLHDLIFDDDTYPGPGETSAFSSGDTAMMVGSASTLNTITDPAITTHMVPQPDNLDGGKDYFMGQAYVSVLKDGSSPELATRLLQYLTSKAASEKLSGFYVSGREALLKPSIVSQASTRITDDEAQNAMIEPLKQAHQITYPAAYPELAAATKADLDSIWQPTADIAGQLKKACAATDPILAKQG
ncbi:sugar ABC transporter substrate-binding protein [Plantibacter sp. VKM Ac-2885]|uniref:ABC transporter substrate-binding protein n=1 Tax=Plantibacter sp. VKM Ac-2885 TaxID=2783828 RepID=UPI00188CDDF3|nr:sugar ABC transporter substrate-binding protein [Plantibacter sp. VKM Ac-2885]MBF4514098.1 sugar ABC transporter substrate-binding protein [Plantibacter sp. VKM Ac-2885]